MSKPKKPPVWSHKATVMSCVAFSQLERTKAKIALLRKRCELLNATLVKEGGGRLPDGRRLAVRHIKAAQRWVSYLKTVKAKDHVVLLKP